MYLVEKSSIRSLKLQYRYWLEADIFRSVIDSPARSKIAIKNIIALESMECCKYKRCRDEGMFEKRVDSKIEKSLRNLAQDGTTDSIKNRVYRFPSEYKKVFSQCPEKIMLERKKRKEPTYTCFLPIPEVVVFRNFSIGCNHECLFQLLNRSEVPRLIKLNESQNLFFQVKFAGSNSNTRLAAGLSHIYDVKFHPDEDRDYYHDIEFETDSGSLAVPVIAIGPQPLVTFPDEINVGVTVVKIKKTILISLENIGKIMTRFSIFSDNECFSVCPTKNSLEVGESMKINITFSPMKLGTFSGFIFFRYESGDTTQSFIKGEAIPCDVKLIDHFVQMEDTFLNLSTLSSISIQNNSDYTLTYKWMKHKSIQDDIKENERCYKECHKKFDTVKGVVAEKLKQIIRDRVCSEIQDDIYFNNEHFHITPAHGEVKARSTLTFSVNFQPRKVGDIIAEGFLDISGIENRIPLSLSGTSMGPILELDRESMDVDKIFLCSTYKFEFKCKNVGRIPGTLSYVQKKTEFNTQIGVKPCKVEICEDSIETLSLHFWSDISGSFVERVDFLILESSEVISLILKGIMVTPLVLHKPIDLNFPLVSLGFSSCRKVTIHNSSHVPVEFSISVPCDGWEPAVGHDEFARALTKPDFPREPREFFVKPTRGTVEAKSLLNFRVYYTPNVVRKGTRSIEVRVGKSLSSEPLILPFSYESTITTMNVKPIKINEGRCFLNYPSKHNITIFNPCNVSGYFFVVPQEVSEDLPLIYSLSVNQGYIKAKQYKEIELKIIAKEVGHHFLRINFFSMGHKEPVAFTDVTVTAYGPVVSTEPFNFKFGQINVLKPREFSFNLINESPIPAPYEIAVKNVKKSSILETEYNIGELEPFETIDINISLILRDVGKYTDNLAILVSKGSTFNIKLSAVGVGCSIVFKPNIFPLLDMGYLFRRQDNTNLITLKNESTRIHNMYLANTERENRGKKNDPDDIQEKFRIEPAAFELHPGEERTVECNIRWPNIEVVQEQWYIFANIEGVNKRELLDSSVFSATFIDPIITFNKNELHFFMNFGWNCEDHQLTNEFTITNKTGRDLNAHMIIEKPFNFKGDSNTWTNDKKLTLVDQKSYIVDVFFRSDLYSFEQQVSTKYQGYLKIQYQEHKQTDKILCVTEVNFPCITLVPTIHLYCIYGSNTEQVISLMNDGSLPAHYKMKIHKSSLKFQRINNFNDLLDLQPIEGMVLPNSEMHVTLALDGSERVKFSIDAVCEVMGGVSQTFTIHATTDIVKYYIEDFVLDYGLQLYCEPSVAALKVTNQCLVPLQFSVATSSTLLKIIEYPEVLNPVSEHIIVIERQPSAPGIFNEALHLEVHSDVMEIHVKWFATFPQVYLDVPRNLLAESSVELGYDAVRLFEKENMDVDEMGCESNFSDDQIINCENELSSNDLALLSAYIDHFQENSDNWESKKDLLYEIVENIKNGATSIEPTVKISSSENKYVIIFHGVANTEYQETACRCAKRLNLPLLDLNKVFLQSLSSTQIKLSKKLSDQLEKHYIEMTSQLKKSTFKGLSDKYQNQIDKIFTKISVSETFEEKNYDYFELKLEILNDILNFSEKYGKPTDKKGSIKNQELSNNQRVLFKDVNSDVFREILRDGLCQAKFNRGYVLQTLKNDFMKNESLILRILLSISNGTENMLFITFNNKISKLYERTEDDNQTELPFKDEKFSTDDIGIENNVSLLIQQSPEMIKEYEDSLNNLFHTINEWEAGLASGKTRKNAKTATKSIFTLASSILAPEKMYVWHVDIDNLKSNCMTYAIENYLSETIPNFIDDTILDECSVEVIPYFLLKEHEIFELQPFHSVASSFVSQTGMGETFSISKKSLTAETIIRTKSENLNLQLYETISLESRLILEPSESKEFKVVFKPIQEGQFKHEFILALMDNPEKTFKIKTLGDAEIPRLNMTPYSIFSKVASQKLIETHEPTYFLSSHCYDFGNFLVSQDQSRMHNKKEIFKFRNIAIVPAVVSFSLQDKNYDIFEIQPLEIVLNPNEIGFVAISVNVNQLGEWKDTLIISIENNLQNEHIELRCNGVQMELIVEPKSINLNRVLLSKCEMKKVTMQSNTALLLFWRVSTELDENQIRCQPVSGKLKYNHTNEIEINFCANKVHGSETKIIRIFLFLSEKEMEPIAIETITLTAESYEIIFDVSPRDSLCLKSIPVGSFTTGSYTITNLGKYPFSYEINYLSLHGLTTNKKNENKSEILQNNFKMEPQSGIILPKKQSLINVTYNPTIEHSLKDTILFILYLMEPYKDYGLVENVSLKISSISYYTKYSIYPYPTLNFETVELKTNKTMTLKVENTGEFALTYSFKHKPLHESQGDFSIVHEKSKTSKRKCGPKKLRSLQSDGSESRYGPFQIEKMKGELQPREFDNLMVQFRADTVGEFEEYFLIDVSDSYLLTDEDRQISLKANVHVANLDFNNFRQMFVNSYVVNSPEEFDFSNKIEEYTVFIKCDNTLHYHNICANDTYATSVTLSNTSDVRADVIIETSCNEAFSVNINRLEIKPWSKEKFILTFNPSREGIYSDTLQMKLDVPESLDPHTLIINLQGEGCLPRVRVIELNEVARDNSEMHFGFLNIPGKVEKLLKIQNIGKVIAKLNIELENNFPEVFKIIENPDREPIDNECIYKTHDKVTELMILPQYAVNLKISFIITNPGQYISNLKIHIDKNPHETIKMKLIGEGFFKPIVFNLVLVYPKSLVNVSECTSSQSIEQLETGFDKNSYPKTVSEEPINWVYKIDFGNCSMKDQNTYKNRYTFKIINATTDQFFRYEWKDDELIQFDPLISTECIINEIILKEPVKFIGYEKDSLGSIVQYTEKLYTKHRKQKYTEHENSSDTASNIRKLATDDLQESEIEPEYEIVTNTTETIKVLVSANLGYCNYECNIDCLEFESTLVSETRSLNFKVANTSNLNLYFNWCLLSKCSKQKDLKCNCKECNCPFTVRPQRGVIAPQESIECDMLFFPTFVDEFEVSFCCKMINLDPAREPLVIKVLASSILSYPFFDFGE
uniref:HYDIN/VesB/CFA65-like Ig-like domain-containing protein n=1 Tax=Trichogramma kaykai TaxID=54128 RepID=A0ABD2WU23_9HYME